MTEVEAAVEALTKELQADIENITVRLLLADALEDAGKVHLASAHRLIADARPKLNLDKEDREGIVLGYLQWMDLDYIREEHVRICTGYEGDLCITFYRAYALGYDDDETYIHAYGRGDLLYHPILRLANKDA